MWSQGYTTRIYEPLFAPLRDEPLTLLELGFGEYDPARGDHNNPGNGGRSAAMWREYFPNALIAVVDVVAKTGVPEGVEFFCGSQDDAEFLRGVYLQTGPFDIIIDDASHVSSLTIASFKILWPYLRPGGVYAVEDVHSSYHDWFFGADEAHPDPGQHHVQTAVNFFKRIADEAFFNGRALRGPKTGGRKTADWDVYPRRYWLGYQVESVTFAAPQLIWIRKREVDDYPPPP